jgi:protein SCO1/2
MSRWLAVSLLLAAAPAAANVPLDKIQVVEKLGERIPAELEFTDSSGAKVVLKDLFQDTTPTLLTLVYYRCPTLCHLVLDGLVGSLRQTGYQLGRDYNVVTVSIDPTEGPADAAKKKAEVSKALGVPSDSPGWTFLTTSTDGARQLADAVGFQYVYDEDLKQYAHAASFFVLTPEAKISRYFYGVRFPPRDLRLALVEAAGGKVGTAFDRFLLTCYRFDPATRRYELYVKGFLRVGALLIFAALATMMGVLWRREFKQGAFR